MKSSVMYCLFPNPIDKIVKGGNNDYGYMVAADGKWHHVVATFDGKVLRAYFDGVMEGETKTEIPPDHNTEPVRIGRWGNPRGDYWSGVLDEVAMFSQALTGDEIQDITMNMRDALAVEAVGKLAVTWGKIKRLASVSP